jgi:hypothetical protein
MRPKETIATISGSPCGNLVPTLCVGTGNRGDSTASLAKAEHLETEPHDAITSTRICFPHY